MVKPFWKLKIGEQFDGGSVVTGWDLLKCGTFTARVAHAVFEQRWFIMPWQLVKTIKPNPNCKDECPCRKF